jgi:uncharacterized membrane protein
MARAQGAVLFYIVWIAGALSAACGASSEPARDGSANGAASATDTTNSAEIRDVRAIYRSRCGSCHVRVEPGTHTRTQLETAFSRHRTRVKMSDAEWSSMVQLLASDASSNAQAAPVSTSK